MKFPIPLPIIALAITLACSGNKDQQVDTTAADSTQAETTDSMQVQTETTPDPQPKRAPFSGEYLVGDGNLYIVPVADTYEIQDGTGKTSDVFYFQGTENDSVSIYLNKDKSITFKMNPDHKTGKYYTADEQLPVEQVGPLP